MALDINHQEKERILPEKRRKRRFNNTRKYRLVFGVQKHVFVLLYVILRAIAHFLDSATSVSQNAKSVQRIGEAPDVLRPDQLRTRSAQLILPQ